MKGRTSCHVLWHLWHHGGTYRTAPQQVTLALYCLGKQWVHTWQGGCAGNKGWGRNATRAGFSPCMQGQPLIGDPWAGHAAAAGAAGKALLRGSSSGTRLPCPQIPGIRIPADPSDSCLPASATWGLLSILLQAMDSQVFWFLHFQSLVHYPQPVGNGLDEVMCLWMETHVKLQEQERIQLEWELEQLMLKPSSKSWGDLMWSALQHWQVWVFAGLLLLVLAPCFLQRSHQVQSSGQEENEEEEDDETWELRSGMASRGAH